MKSFRKAVIILKSHGFRALARRTAAKVKSSFQALGDRRQRNRSWKKGLRLLPVGADINLVPPAAEPEVSIIIPVYDRDRFTYNCLRSIANHLDVPAEIIVVDDGSSEDTVQFLRSIAGVRWIRNEHNIGYVASCNRGAAVARGSSLLFLNNDTLIQPGWLSTLLTRKKSDSTIGAVGSLLVYPNRVISEAGAIIWRDGSGWNFGRGFCEDDPASAYVRDVDYCSGASLLVDRAKFFEIGGFDERYAPAYYEDADLCFALRKEGLRTVFEPRSVVVHFEGATGGIDERIGVKQFQVRNRALFAEKWREELQAHYAPDSAMARVAARRLSGRPRLLVIDRFVPFGDRDAGSLRLFNILILLHDLGYDITFYPDEGIAHEPYAQQLRDCGVEVLTRTRSASAHGHLRARRGIFDVAWLCRPEIMARYATSLRQQGCRIWYDTVDLHFIRLQRQESVTGRATHWRQMRRLELNLAMAADMTIVTSPVEGDVLSARGIESIRVIPPVQAQVEHIAPLSERVGVLFLGNFVHEPNVDAACHLVAEIFPELARAIPELHLTVAGNDPPPLLLNMRSEAISVLGHINDLSPTFQRARVFLAPIRFGSGIKGKLLQSMAHGLPVVTTSIGAEGIPLEHGLNAFITDSDSDFVRYAHALYADERLWQRMSQAALDVVAHYRPQAVRQRLRELLDAVGVQALSAPLAN